MVIRFDTSGESAFKQPIKKLKPISADDLGKECVKEQSQDLKLETNGSENEHQKVGNGRLVKYRKTRFEANSLIKLLTDGLFRTYCWINYVKTNKEQTQTVIRIDKDFHDKEEKIGSGSYGEVFICGSDVIKISKVISRRLKQEDQKKFFMFSFFSSLKENRCQKYLIDNHVRNVSSYLRGHIIGPYQYCIHMPYSGVALREFCNSYEISLTFVFFVTRSLLQTLTDMNKLGIIHCDIKPENILCTQDPLKLTLIDFGFAQSFEPNLGFVECPKGYIIQPLNYRSIFAVLQTPIGSNVDLWSLGCILFEIFTKEYLFKTDVCGDINEQQLHHLANIISLIGIPPQSLIDTSKSELKDKHFVFCEDTKAYKSNADLEKTISYYKQKNTMFGFDFSIEARMKNAAKNRNIKEDDPSFLKVMDLIKQLIAFEHRNPSYYLNFLEEIAVNE
ncbi:MAG: protein kinase [Parachlamydiales bacterium]|jgi:serine/threonine protein kinase